VLILRLSQELFRKLLKPVLAGWAAKSAHLKACSLVQALVRNSLLALLFCETKPALEKADFSRDQLGRGWVTLG
jgi:hypothetical protein